MKRATKLFLQSCSFLLATTSASALAVDVKVQVCDLQSHTDKNIAFMRPCEWKSKNSCPIDYWVAWDMSKNQGEAMYSTALTALVAEKQVTVRLDGSSCLGQYDEVSMIRISR